MAAVSLSGLIMRPLWTLEWTFKTTSWFSLLPRKLALLVPIGIYFASKPVQGCSPNICDLDLKILHFWSSTYLFGAMVPSGAQKRAQQVWNDSLCNLPEYLKDKREKPSRLGSSLCSNPTLLTLAVGRGVLRRWELSLPVAQCTDPWKILHVFMSGR